ncbi:hypothetical protein [Bacillus sp. T3]|uniref:hypothetical protein n=1 Tax=Bacillus sp. T3 TaxID=467262 RepID=UPI002981EACE|nr:hypothetical protein [Bacillus sp. T3]
MNLSYESVIQLHPIDIREDRKNYIVEDKLTGEYFEMPAICIHAIEMIENEYSLLEIEKELKAVYPQEEVNLIEFIEQLIEMELIQEVDGQTIEYSKINSEKLGFLWIPERFGMLFFNRYTVVLYGLLFFINLGILITNPQYIPHYKDLFIFDVMMYNILFYMAISFVLVFIHEFGHILAIRAAGLPTKLEIGHRLFLVVLETDMTQVWSLPINKRNRLYLAGMCFDVVLLTLALFFMILFPNTSSLLIGICGIIVYDVIIRMIYQCCIYMKTDLYYVFENSFGCYNLMENAQNYLKGKLLSKRPNQSNQIFAGEKGIVIVYGVGYLVGMALSLTLLVGYILPQIMFVIKDSVAGITVPVSSIQFWDAIVVFLQLILGFGLLLYSWTKTYKMKYK